jgi:DUF4097 and DUF4098 domain-containing protein YvlB
MNTTTKVVLIVAVVLVVCAIGAAVTLSIMVGRSGMPNWKGLLQSVVIDIDESAELDLSGVNNINIENVSGRIIVAPGEPRATLTGRITTSTDKKTFLDVQNVGGSLAVRADFRTIYPNFISGDMVLTVYLPEDIGVNTTISGTSSNADVSGIRFGSLSVHSTSGTVKVSGCSGSSLDVGSTSGGAEVRDVSFGSMDVSSTSGSVTVDDAEGNLAADCTSGSVKVNNVTGAVDVGNTSGDVSVTLRQTQLKPVRIHSISGSIRLALSPDAAFDLDVDTVSGGFYSAFDITISGKKPGKVTGEDISGKVNGGGVFVELSTVSGSIDLVKAE